MANGLESVKLGLLMSMLILLFGIGLGVSFGVNEDGIKGWIDAGIAAHQDKHDSNSSAKIWRFSQRAHFHAMGLGASTLALILAVAMSSMGEWLKQVTSLLIGLGSLYPLSWFTMFLLAPSMGRDEAHHAFLTELWTWVGVGSLLAGLGILFLHVLTGRESGAPVGE
ncbi:MAG: hypothetical protein HQL82_08305 [Magnetococcales bacterium]|nr:hypothetical protein [Magnetococcales bacterium]